MLKALCNDLSLRSGCTCSQRADVMLSPNYSVTRRLSLSQPLSDQPGTVARPYSWASESGPGGPLFAQQLVDVDPSVATSHSSPAELVNGGLAMRSGLGHLVHHNSDSAAACENVYRTHYTERIMANH